MVFCSLMCLFGPPEVPKGIYFNAEGICFNVWRCLVGVWFGDLEPNSAPDDSTPDPDPDPDPDPVPVPDPDSVSDPDPDPDSVPNPDHNPDPSPVPDPDSV